MRPKSGDLSPPVLPELNWIEIVRQNKPAGELLAAFELSEECPPPTQIVPEGIRPTLQRTRIEVSV